MWQYVHHCVTVITTLKFGWRSRILPESPGEMWYFKSSCGVSFQINFYKILKFSDFSHSLQLGDFVLKKSVYLCAF